MVESPLPILDGSQWLTQDQKNLITQYMPWIAGGGALFVILLLLLIGRKDARGSSEELASGEQREEAPPESDEGPDATPDESEGAQPEAGSEVRSEFSPGALGSLREHDDKELDVVAEADVYIAYGRYQQAEHLLRQAMEKDPASLELKQKLLEVFYATRNKEGFVALAQDLKTAGQEVADAESWARTREMGYELDPSNPLFSRGEQGAGGLGDDLAEQPTPDADLTAEDDFVLDDLDLDSIASELTASDADTQRVETGDEQTGTAEPMEDLEALELDLSALDTEEREAGPADSEEPMPMAGDEKLDVDDLEVQLGELGDRSLPGDELSSMVADLGSGEPEEVGQAGGEVADLSGKEPLDQPISLDEAFVSEELEDVTPLAGDKDLPGEADMDAVETKLDLARAYLEMGDNEGARGILHEVQNEGSDSQREAAAKMLAEMT